MAHAPGELQEAKKAAQPRSKNEHPLEAVLGIATVAVLSGALSYREWELVGLRLHPTGVTPRVAAGMKRPAASNSSATPCSNAS